MIWLSAIEFFVNLSNILRLEEFDAADKERLDLQSARNSLETFIYKCKELTYDDDFEDIASEEDQNSLKAAASEASEWYEDNAEASSRKDLIAKKNELFKIGGPIFKRRREHSMRPPIVESLQSEIEKAQNIFAEFSEKLNETTVTEEELEKFKVALKDVSDWLNEKVTEQAALKNSVDPILTVQSLEEKRNSLATLVEKFDFKKRRKPIAKAPSSSSEKANEEEELPGDFDPGMMDEETKQKLKDPNISQEEMMKVIQDAIAKKLKTNPPPKKQGKDAAEGTEPPLQSTEEQQDESKSQNKEESAKVEDDEL